MLDAHQAVPTRALRPSQSGALTQDPNDRGRGDRSPTVWMQYADPSPETLLQTRHVHHWVMLRIIGAQHKRPNHRMTSYNRALEMTGCESIETTLRARQRLWAGALVRMSDGRLPKRIMLGNLEDTVRRGRGEKEKEWTDCVQSDIRALGIAGDWEATA